MSSQPPIALRQGSTPNPLDEDVHRLIANTGLSDFPYHDIHDQERLAARRQRWALLRELGLAGTQDDG